MSSAGLRFSFRTNFPIQSLEHSVDALTIEVSRSASIYWLTDLLLLWEVCRNLSVSFLKRLVNIVRLNECEPGRDLMESIKDGTQFHLTFVSDFLTKRKLLT